MKIKGKVQIKKRFVNYHDRFVMLDVIERTNRGKRVRHSGTHRISVLTRVSVHFTNVHAAACRTKGPWHRVCIKIRLPCLERIIFVPKTRAKPLLLPCGCIQCRFAMFAVKIVYYQVTMEFVENVGNIRYYLYFCFKCFK